MCGVLGWLAGKVVCRYVSFTFFFLKKTFLDFYLKPKSLTLKEKKYLKPKKCFLGQKLKSFLPSLPNWPHTLGVVSVTQQLRSPAIK